MRPERMAELVAGWVRLYTRDLPPSIAQRRIGEIDADLHDHIAHERAGGTADRRIALSIAARMVRGLPADAAWRRSTITTRKEPMQRMSPARRSAVRIALATALVVLLPLAAMLVFEGVDWGVFDFVLAAVVVAGTGLVLELAARKPASLVLRAAAAAIGVAAMVLGESDDAPGLVLFGLLVVLGAVALTVRTAQRGR
jgi:hypothetical protein